MHQSQATESPLQDSWCRSELTCPAFCFQTLPVVVKVALSVICSLAIFTMCMPDTLSPLNKNGRRRDFRVDPKCSDAV